MTLAELRDEIQALITAGNFKFTNLSADGRQAFADLFRDDGRRFPQDKIDVLRRFWFRAAAPTNPQVIAANELLPPDRQIVPVQALNGNWYVNLDILTDQKTWGPIFPFLRNVTIERLDPAADFPQEEAV